jgi:hypothetical protein
MLVELLINIIIGKNYLVSSLSKESKSFFCIHFIYWLLK